MRIKSKLREIELGTNRISISEEGKELGKFLLDKGYLNYITRPIIKYERQIINIPNGIDAIITNVEGKSIAIKYKFTMSWLTSLESKDLKAAFKQCEQLNINNILIITNHTKADSSIYKLSKKINCHIVGRSSILAIAKNKQNKCIIS